MFSFYLLRILIIVMCVGIVCESARLGTKVKRKVDHRSVENRIIDRVNNITEKETGRGFLPTGGIFALGKVLNFFPVGGERECRATRGSSVARSGICLNPYDCRQRDGQAGGDCAHGLGVCCVFEVSCGGVIKNNLTYFVSPGFPELWPGGGDCRVTIDKAHAGIMQLRVDFIHFNIGQPNRSTGECDQDVMTLGSGGKDDSQFRMCGQNHGQHIYYTLSTASESRESEDDLPWSTRSQLIIRPRGYSPRLWLLRIAQMPLAHSAPNDCLQYYTGVNGTITTFNYAINGRHLANQDYNACVRKNPGFCAIRYRPCDERSFRIGPGNGEGIADTYTSTGPGSEGGPGTGFYGPDGSFIQGPMVPSPSAPAVDVLDVDQQGVETENDQVADEDGMMPVQSDPAPQMDEIEGSGESQFGEAGMDAAVNAANGAAVSAGVPPPSMASRIWSFVWPTWLWDDGDEARTWGLWPYWHKHEEDPLIQGYEAPAGSQVFGRMGCQDRITIPCDNEEFISGTLDGPGSCDPHHCGPSFCPGLSFRDCRVQTSVSPFSVSMHFGDPQMKSSAEDNIGACLMYTQLPCEA